MKFGTRTFLERPEWKSVPWELSTQSKDSSQYLDDIFADLPAIGDDVDTWKVVASSAEPSETKHRIRNQLRACILDHLRQLIEWGWEFEKMNPSIAYTVQVDPATSLTLDEDSRPLFPTVFHFADLKIAQMIVLYTTTFLWLLRAGSYVLERPFTLSMIPSLGPPSERTNPLNFPCKNPVDGLFIAHEICRSLECRMLRVRSSRAYNSVVLASGE